jgi:SagB-type dehydrogenase family enzyme
MLWKKHDRVNKVAWISGLPFWGLFVMASFAENKTIQLPPPNQDGSVPVEKAIAERRSIREYTEDSLSLEIVSQMMWASQGKTHGEWGRAAPSAGATYPLEIYLVANRVEGLEPGVYHYLVRPHALEIIKVQNVSEEISESALGQNMILKAAFNIVIAADYERTAGRYGARGERYVHIEVGHVGQNIYLQAQALGLGTVAVGAYDDLKVKALLRIQEDVLYIMPIGRPVPKGK